MHILFVANYYFGNPDVVKLSTELAKGKHRISVVTCVRNTDKNTHIEGINAVETRPLITIHSIGYPLSFPFSRVYKLVRKEGVDIIYTLNDLSTNTAIAALVSRLTNVPLVYKIQGIGSTTNHLLVDTLVKVYCMTVERLIMARAKRTILDSKCLVSEAIRSGVKKGSIVIIPYGVNYGYFDPERLEVRKNGTLLRHKLNIDGKIVVGYVGRLVPVKGLFYLILALKQIQSEYPNVVLLVVGDGPQRKSLETTVRDLGVKAIFVGWQSDVLVYYAVMDIFVLPSLSEALPNVMLEAMAMRKSIVATEVGMNPDLIINGRNGFLVPVQNPEQIGSALKKLIENSDLRRSMGLISRQAVKETFSWEKIVPRFEKLCDDVYAGEN